MGLEYSCFELIRGCLDVETTTTKSDGTIIHVKKDPLVMGITVTGAMLLLLVYVDNGKGFLSKAFSKS